MNRSSDDINEALDESFPASDPPAWTAGEAKSICREAERRIWILEPIASPEDPQWKGYAFREPILIEADNAAKARIAATKWYHQTFEKTPQEKQEQFNRSAFEDEKLYKTRKLENSELEENAQKYTLANV